MDRLLWMALHSVFHIVLMIAFLKLLGKVLDMTMLEKRQKKAWRWMLFLLVFIYGVSKMWFARMWLV